MMHEDPVRDATHTGRKSTHGSGGRGRHGAKSLIVGVVEVASEAGSQRTMRQISVTLVCR